MSFAPRDARILQSLGDTKVKRGGDDALADSLRLQEERLPFCQWCKCDSLYVLEERPDPHFGRLGVVQRILKCGTLDCGKVCAF